MIIGICDDEFTVREYIKVICNEYFEEKVENVSYKYFVSGEEVLAYCSNQNAEQIDLLFLDIQMCGIDGIKVKESVIKKDKIWRIVFVSSHLEVIQLAFGLKTIGFISKPVKKTDLAYYLDMVRKEIKENIVISLDSDFSHSKRVYLEEIEYIEADKNYTRVYLYSEELKKHEFSTKSIKKWEEDLLQHDIIRIHKSYLVNLAHVMCMEKNQAQIRSNKKLPIGRSYKKEVICCYHEYLRNKVRERM